MAGDAPNLGKVTVDPTWKIAVVRSVWHSELTSELAKTAVARLLERGVREENIIVLDAPGSYELPLYCQKVLEADADGVIAFGIVLQGATHHADLVAREAARGCMDVQLTTGKPVTFEVIYVNVIEDAHTRTFGPGGKGPLAADTLLSCLAGLPHLQR